MFCERFTEAGGPPRQQLKHVVFAKERRPELEQQRHEQTTDGRQRRRQQRGRQRGRRRRRGDFRERVHESASRLEAAQGLHVQGAGLLSLAHSQAVPQRGLFDQ